MIGLVPLTNDPVLIRQIVEEMGGFLFTGGQDVSPGLYGQARSDCCGECSADIEHHQNPPYDVPCHTVTVLEGSPLHKLLGKDRIKVNSYHHQAIRDLAEGLERMAVSEDGLTEAVRACGKQFIWAVQWHPEFSFRKDEDSQKIFHAFVRNAELRRNVRLAAAVRVSEQNKKK